MMDYRQEYDVWLACHEAIQATLDNYELMGMVERKVLEAAEAVCRLRAVEARNQLPYRLACQLTYPDILP